MAVPRNIVSVQGVTQIDDSFLNTLVQGCTTVAALRTFTGVANMAVTLLGLASLNDGGGGVFYWANGSFTDDGYNVIVPFGTTNGAWLRASLQDGYAIDFSYLGTDPPSAGLGLMLHIFTEPVTFKPDFSGSAGYVKSLPTDPYVCAITRINPTVTVGSMTIGTDGTFAFSTDGEAVAFAPGQAITITGNATPDATLNTFCGRLVA